MFFISVKQRDSNGVELELELELKLVNFISLFSCALYWAEGVRDIRAGWSVWAWEGERGLVRRGCRKLHKAELLIYAAQQILFGGTSQGR